MMIDEPFDVLEMMYTFYGVSIFEMYWYLQIGTNSWALQEM